MKKNLIFFIFLGVSLFAKQSISVSILPQKYFLEQIAENTLDINVLVPPGASPATYEPKPRQMEELEKSDIYFAIGVPFERVWLKKFKEIFPKLQIVKTQEGVEKIAMKSHNPHSHDDKKILDPHIWLDPILVKIQAKNMVKALIKKYPQNKALYEKNLNAFNKKLDNLDAKIKNILKNKQGKTFLVYHPSWGYFAKRYGLNQQAIEIEGKKPRSKDLQKIINEAKEKNIPSILVQRQFSQKSAKVIASQINGKVISIDQLSPKWEEELIRTAKILEKTLK
ncbi:MAG: cation ABC transporter substrate-binding protein [Proteobacteria bacterium]|nr:MAG: cation ABC transporter substrate-binding protein [Pseudomonadota bacterium]